MIYLLGFLASLAPVAIGALVYLIADKIRDARAESVALDLAHRASGRACAAQSSEIAGIAAEYLSRLAVSPVPVFISKEGSDS